MDMKKILRTIDNASIEGSSSDMQRLRNIVEGKGPLNRSTPAESIAMQHYAEPKKTITAPVLNVQEDARPSMIGKYFKAVEEELQESAQRGNLRTRQLAERVTTRLNELSTATLASYKKKAGADASKADKEGDFERGNKRFKGINKATIKQFDNDTKKEKGVAEEWSKKYKSSINCSHPKGFSQKAHCAGKKKHTESMTLEAVCPDCGMCKSHGNLNEIAKGAKDSNGVTKCWPGKHAEGTKKGRNGGQVRNCVPNESVEQGVAEGKVGADPYDRGYRDGQRMGSNSYHNPYSRSDEPFEWDEYKSGFNMAQTELQNDIEDNNFSEGVAEGLMNKIANKVMGVAPEQPKYKVGQRVKYETSPHQPDWKDGGRGVGVITAYKNGHYMINGNPVNHFEIKGVVEKGVAEGLVKDIKRLATGKDVKSRAGQEIAKSQDASMKGDNKTSKKHFDRYDKLDKLANKEQGVAEGEKKGLYYNVNKRKAAGTSRPASSPKAPTAQAWKDAAKTAKKEGVAEGERTMSRAAKGYEKYGKKGMMALAKAGKEGKDLDSIRDKYNKYDEAANAAQQAAIAIAKRKQVRNNGRA